MENRIRDAAGSGLERAAEAAHRAGDWASGRGGGAERVGDAVHGAAGSMEDAATYVRTRSMQGARHDLERTVELHPMRSLLLAAGAGFLVGRLLR